MPPRRGFSSPVAKELRLPPDKEAQRRGAATELAPVFPAQELVPLPWDNVSTSVKALRWERLISAMLSGRTSPPEGCYLVSGWTPTLACGEGIVDSAHGLVTAAAAPASSAGGWQLMLVARVQEVLRIGNSPDCWYFYPDMYEQSERTYFATEAEARACASGLLQQLGSRELNGEPDKSEALVRIVMVVIPPTQDQ